MEPTQSIEQEATLEDLTTVDSNTLPTEEDGKVTLPNGKYVYVRGLTGFEVSLMTKMGQGDQVKTNALAMSMGLVRPRLNDKQALAFMKVRPAIEMKLINDKINELSGLVEGAEGKAYKSV